MKKLLSLFIIITSALANDLFLYDTDSSNELSDVINNKIVTLENVAGKTYSLHNNLTVTSGTNGVTTYILPHRIAVKQLQSASAYFAGDLNLKYTADFKLPQVLSVAESALNFSAIGELYVVSEHTNTVVIGTSMINITFDSAKLFIKAGEKYTQLYVNSGKVTTIDAKSSKKRKELKAGDYLVVTPQVVLSPREGAVKAAGNSFSTKDIEDDELKQHKEQFDKLTEQLHNTLFVNYGTNVFGVKLK